jgi:hypothetical protein
MKLLINENGVRVVSSATSKNLIVKFIMFPLCNIHKFTWISQIDHILIDRKLHSSVLIVSFRGADCDTEHSLVVTKVRERLAVSK